MDLFDDNPFRSQAAIRKRSAEIRDISRRPVRLMEVCGGHTMAIHRFGLPSLLPPTIELVSGPGCPVCVSSQEFLDRCIWLSRLPEVIIATYGDLIRVPASDSSLEVERSLGADIRIVYSVSEALKLARDHPRKEVIFLGIGFETTAPASAFAVREAARNKLMNFSLISGHKIMPPALKALVDEELRIDGFIAPGHVSSITGIRIYDFLAEVYGKGVVVCGFEPLDLMESIHALITQIESGSPRVENQYRRVVRTEGNLKALNLLEEIFEPVDDLWRGIGMIPGSGLQLRKTYQSFDAGIRFGIPEIQAKEPAGCICGAILKGVKRPADCPLFGEVCTPANPVGACMVSGEGSCAIAFKYNRI